MFLKQNFQLSFENIGTLDSRLFRILHPAKAHTIISFHSSARLVSNKVIGTRVKMQD